MLASLVAAVIIALNLFLISAAARRLMSYFRAVRLYSAIEATLFSALLVVWIGNLGEERAGWSLGWTHGFGWIILCVLVYVGAQRRIFPWPLLAATVSPLGPLGCTIGFEVLRHSARAAGYADRECSR